MPEHLNFELLQYFPPLLSDHCCKGSCEINFYGYSELGKQIGR